jgi:rhodanese-related sulfurtransferase
VRAKSFGYTNIAEMPGGIHGWVDAGKKTQPVGG